MKGILFDLDGTLIDSLSDLAAAAGLALKQLGYPCRELSEIRSFMGDGAYTLMERLLPAGEVTEENIYELMRLYKKNYAENCMNETKPYDKIPEVLSELKTRGYRLGVVSNKPDNMTKHMVSHIFGDIFDAVEGQKDGYPVKPDPTLANEVIGRLGLSAGEYYFIGDSGVDMETAKNCGAIGIGVLWGYRQKEEIAASGAVHMVKTADEILNYT